MDRARRRDRGEPLRYLDLSGYAFTGKAAVIDLMREVRGCSVPSSEFEFALLRVKDGILDLEEALLENWSPVRSCEAVRRFKNLISVYGGDRRFGARLGRHGHHYDRMFRGFTRRSHTYIDSLVDHAWRGEWPFASDFQPRIEVIVRKLAFKARLRSAATYPIYLAAPSRDKFQSATTSYLDDVLSRAAGPEHDIVVTHNAFEPFDPVRSMRFFDDARIIVVDRDPRDVYVAAHRYVGSDGRRGWEAATGGSVEGFVDQFRTYRAKVRHERDDHRVLRIPFESLVMRYEETAARILRFIGKSATDHIYPKRNFDPARSAAGINAWKSFSDQRAIAVITDRLAEFLISS